MAKIGYARVSSKEQNIDRQLEKLKDCSKIFKDVKSGASAELNELQSLIDYIREDDVVIVTELDRIGRNNKQVTQILKEIQGKGATLQILNLPSLGGIEDTNLRKLINNLILEIYLYQAESERKMIKERQKQGIEIAKKKGHYKGRKRMFDTDSDRIALAKELLKQGNSMSEIARKTGINRSTLYKYIK